VTAPAPVGITARIKFTSRLVNSSLMGERTSPLLKGATGRLWIAQGGKLRLELQSDRGDTQIVSDGHRFLFSDPSSHTVYTGAVPADREHQRAHREHKPSLAEVNKGLGRLGRFAQVLGPGREVVGGRPAYSVRVKPKNNHGLFAGLGGAWDAIRGVPLRLAVYATGVKSPVLELEATDVTYGPVAASVFRVSAPKNAKVHSVDTSRHERLHRSGSGKKHRAITGVAAVKKVVPFLSAPDRLAGRGRTEVRLVDSHRAPAAVVAYGKPLLGGLVVIEHRIDKTPAHKSDNTRNLPHVKIGGVDATEVSTALGTLVGFDRGGVHYVVVGPVRKATAEAAARGL
jgi:outer membrane lipoprotein-sorting protein